MTQNPDRGDIMRLLDDYNSNPDKFTDDQAEKIAQVAKAYGVDFRRENKAGRKLAFDLADTALLGFVPNEWRPTSRGQETFGETGIDRVGGAVGTVAGMVGTGGLALANAGRIGRGVGKVVGKGLGYGQHYAPKAYDSTMRGAGYAYNKASALASRGAKGAKKIYADGPSYANKMGQVADRGRASFQGAKNATTSLERGTSTSYLSRLNNNFRTGYNSRIMNSAQEEANLLDILYKGGQQSLF